MHLVSSQRMGRLKSNKRAYDHYEKYRSTYIRYANEISYLVGKFPELRNEETRVNLVASWIIEFDSTIWALKSDGMTAQEIAESYARLVVGHEK